MHINATSMETPSNVHDDQSAYNDAASSDVRNITMDGVMMDYTINADGVVQPVGVAGLEADNNELLTAKMLASLQPDENGTYSVPGEYGMVHSGSPENGEMIWSSIRFRI